MEKYKKAQLDLETLIQEIEKAQTNVKTQHRELDEKMDALLQKKQIQRDAAKQAIMENEVKSYINSLTEISKVVQFQLVHLDKVFKGEEKGDMEKLTSEIKRFCKSIRKDLSVSYSRFNFGFESQKKHLDYLEQYMEQQ